MNRSISLPQIAIVMPVRNENLSILQVFEELRDHVGCELKVVLIYDDPSDATLLLKSEVEKILPNTKLVRNQFGSGVVNAIMTGVNVTEDDYIIFMMADLSDTAVTIPEMISKMSQGYTAVIASRYCKGGMSSTDPLLKQTLSFLANKSLSFLTSIPLSDFTNAFAIYQTRFLKSLTVESVGGFEFTMELIYKVCLKRERIAEVPTINRPRSFGKSNFRTIDWLPHYLRWYIKILLKFGLPFRENWLRSNFSEKPYNRSSRS